MVDLTDEEGRRTRPFADFLAEHNQGASHTQASLQLQELVTAVAATGKKGSVAVTVAVEPMKANPSAMVTIVTVTAKVPTDPPKAAVFYADDDGNLTRDDPAQPTFEGLRDVPTRGAVRDLGASLRPGENFSIGGGE
jgi:hypothetical protein